MKPIDVIEMFDEFELFPLLLRLDWLHVHVHVHENVHVHKILN